MLILSSLQYYYNLSSFVSVFVFTVRFTDSYPLYKELHIIFSYLLFTVCQILGNELQYLFSKYLFLK